MKKVNQILLPGEEPNFQPDLCECGWPLNNDDNRIYLCDNPFCSEVLPDENDLKTKP